MKRFLIAIGLVLSLSGELKGAQMALQIFKHEKNQVIVHGNELIVPLTLSASEDLSDVSVKFSLAGKAPIMPVINNQKIGKDGVVRSNSIPRVSPRFDLTQFVPGKEYTLVLDVSYTTTDGKGYNEQLKTQVLVPDPKDPAEKVKGKFKKLEARVEVNENKGVYKYHIKNNEARITSFQLDVSSFVQVTGVPKGWKDIKVDGRAVTWVTLLENAAKGSVSGFEITGSPKRDNVNFFLMGKDGNESVMVGGQTIGPGN